MPELIYCATPARLMQENAGIVYTIMNYVLEQGRAPFHPFQAFPYELFKGNPLVGREQTLQLCERAIKICDGVWIFGVSDGTLREAQYARKMAKHMELKLQFDRHWEKFYAELRSRHKGVLDDIIAAAYGSLQ